jgi:hypothetical protein
MSTESTRRKVKGIQHRVLWEDFYDTVLAQERQYEPRETLAEVRKRVLGKR